MGPYLAGSGNTILGQAWQQFQGGNNPAVQSTPAQPSGQQGQPAPQNYGQQGTYNTLAQDLSNQDQGQYSFAGNRFSYQPAQQTGFRQQWPGFFQPPPPPPPPQYGWGGPQYIPGGSPFGGFGGFGGYSNPYGGFGGFGGYGGYGGRYGGSFGRFY